MFDTNSFYLLQTAPALPCYLLLCQLSPSLTQYKPLSFICPIYNTLFLIKVTSHPMNLTMIWWAQIKDDVGREGLEEEGMKERGEINTEQHVDHMPSATVPLKTTSEFWLPSSGQRCENKLWFLTETHSNSATISLHEQERHHFLSQVSW